MFVPIRGYENIYEINEKGIVRRVKDKKIIKQWIHKVGYPCVSLHKGKQKKNIYVHRLLAEHFIPNPENKLQVNHIDGNKQNNSLDNLEWVTPSENIQHAFKTGLNKSNIKNKKLSQEEIKDLFLNRFLKGESITSIANDPKVNLKLSALSVQFKNIAKKLNMEQEYIEEFKSQKLKRSKIKGLNTRKFNIIFCYKNNRLKCIGTSITDVANKLNARSGNVTNVLKGRAKTTNGYSLKEFHSPEYKGVLNKFLKHI